MNQISYSQLSKQEQELVDHAKQVLEQSYSPYSNFKVGCALLAADGSIVVGTNVENASYGLAICAERSALVRCRRYRARS